MSGLASLKKRTIAAVTLSLGLCLIGCGLGPRTSNTTSESTGITPQSTGQIAVASFSEQDSLTGTLSTAASGLDNLSLDSTFSLAAASNLGKQGLGKIRSGAEDPVIDLSDTASGKARFIVAKKNILVESHDTAIVKWDNIARDTAIKDKNIISVSGEKIHAGEKTERYSVTDLDGDGVVAGEAKFNGKARFSYQATRSEVTEKLVLDVSAGADKNFNTEADNQVLALAWERTGGIEQTAKAAFADADGDGILIDKSKETQSAVDVTLFQKNPPFKPLVDSLTLTIRVLTDGKDKAKDKIIRLSGREYRQSGRIITVAVTDVHGNGDVMPGDTAIAVFALIPAYQNGWKDTVRLVFGVQSGLQNPHDNLLYALHISKEHQSGVVKNRVFDFTTSQPVTEGQKPKSGHVEMKVTYGNDKTASLIADFNETGFSGTWTGPNGNTITVSWDSNGDVVSDK
jgi:hypothetical protein